MGGETAELAVGGHDPVAGNDEREWVTAESLSNGARGAGSIDLSGNFAVGLDSSR